ncbi:MAG: hypothetical protein H5T73_06620 [Actinobacteria bacterium]|nr:hypothetical protein [Actinomycetota bacterium]
MIRILFVCTGNICRSPMAESLLRQRLSRDYPHIDFVDSSSAGTSAVEGNPATSSSVQAMDLWGRDLSGHRASVLTPRRLREADLVLAMAREHLLTIERIEPAALRRSTTLRHLASRVEEIVERLGEETVLDEDDARARLDRVLEALRASTSPEGYLADMHSRASDIIDPIGSSLQVYIGVADDLDAAMQGALRALFGRPL